VQGDEEGWQGDTFACSWGIPPSQLTHWPRKVCSQEGMEVFGYNSEVLPSQEGFQG